MAAICFIAFPSRRLVVAPGQLAFELMWLSRPVLKTALLLLIDWGFPYIVHLIYLSMPLPTNRYSISGGGWFPMR